MDYIRKTDQGTKSDGTAKTITIMNRLNSIRSNKGLKPISVFDLAQAVSKRASFSERPLLEGTTNVSFPEERLESTREARETGKSDIVKTAVRLIHRNSEEGY